MKSKDKMEPPTGDYLLDGVVLVLRRYVILPTEHHYVALALWIMATHALDAFEFAPRLALISPEKRCGKTRTMEVAEPLCHNPFRTINASAAVLFRRNTMRRLTILFDEADTVFGKGNRNDASKEDLRGFYNGGFARGAGLDRCVDGGKKLVRYRSFAMVMIASIGELPDTIMDRAVVFRMRRRAQDEKVEPFRRRLLPGLRKGGEKLAEWCAEHLEELADADPDTKPLVDREADVWAPLLAVADVAGGEWPSRARAAAEALTQSESGYSEPTFGLELLRDIRALYPTDVKVIPTMMLLNLLKSDTPEVGGDWANHRFGNSGQAGLTAYWLSKFLKPYGVQPPKQHKTAEGKVRGYLWSEIAEAANRYLPPVESETDADSPPPKKHRVKHRAVA